MARSRADYERIRAVNRSAIGLSGLDLGGLGIAGPSAAKIKLAFPEVDLSWSPGSSDATTDSTGGAVSRWLAAHVIRPTAQAGPITFDPWQDQADYSGIAKGLAYVATGFGVGGLAWLLVRALWPTRRSNPRRRAFR